MAAFESVLIGTIHRRPPPMVVMFVKWQLAKSAMCRAIIEKEFATHDPGRVDSSEAI